MIIEDCIYERDGFEIDEFVPKRRNCKVRRQKDEIVRLVAEGKSQREIARTLKVDKVTVWRFLLYL